MPEIRGRLFHLGEVIALEDVQDLQSRNALARRRDLPDVVSAIARAHRLHPRGGVLGEVARGEEAAVFLREADDGVGNASLVERIAAVPGDFRIASGQEWILEDFAGPRRAIA